MSQKREERIQQIISLLAKEKEIEVTALSKQLKVSQVTIRKDLNELENRGIIVREHGYARLRNSDDTGDRLAYHYETKCKIAAKAAELVKNGDTVMIENGSCCALLASLLAQQRRELTIITNSSFIAHYIRQYTNIQIILLGGIYQHNSQCLVGPMIKEAVSHYSVKYLFIGTDGWSKRTGFTTTDPLRAEAVRDMSVSAATTVILTESEKFSHSGTFSSTTKAASQLLITDDQIPENAAAALTAEKIKIITV